MPRKSRIDAPGTLNHVTARGVHRSKVFQDDADRKSFIDRLVHILSETDTRCLAWSLMPDHFHLLLKSGKAKLSTVMGRLLTGYAVTYNRRHRRHGHLFQNRYKSILCQEGAYLKELVRYIHLNPIRAGMVKDMKSLDRYVFSGHSALMGRIQRKWQDTRRVLTLFGERTSARQKYREFVMKGVALGKRPDLTGGGLIRSAGGWTEVKRMRKAGDSPKSDERILGDGHFVEKVLRACEEKMERSYSLKARGYDLESIAQRVSALTRTEPWRIWKPGKQRALVKARSLLCFWAVRELGISMTELSRRLGVSLSAVSQSVMRGERIVISGGHSLFPLEAMCRTKGRPPESPAWLA